MQSFSANWQGSKIDFKGILISQHKHSEYKKCFFPDFIFIFGNLKKKAGVDVSVIQNIEEQNSFPLKPLLRKKVLVIFRSRVTSHYTIPTLEVFEDNFFSKSYLVKTIDSTTFHKKQKVYYHHI